MRRADTPMIIYRNALIRPENTPGSSTYILMRRVTLRPDHLIHVDTPL
jgi:hypothetical protein